MVAPPSDAEIVADCWLETAVVEIENVAEVKPAATVTDAGTLAAMILLDKLTVVPPVAAGPFKLTVPVAFPPPVTDAGFTVTLEMVTGRR